MTTENIFFEDNNIDNEEEEIGKILEKAITPDLMREIFAHIVDYGFTTPADLCREMNLCLKLDDELDEKTLKWVKIN